jgi:hypothetical protein
MGNPIDGIPLHEVCDRLERGPEGLVQHPVDDGWRVDPGGKGEGGRPTRRIRHEAGVGRAGLLGSGGGDRRGARTRWRDRLGNEPGGKEEPGRRDEEEGRMGRAGAAGGRRTGWDGERIIGKGRSVAGCGGVGGVQLELKARGWAGNGERGANVSDGLAGGQGTGTGAEEAGPFGVAGRHAGDARGRNHTMSAHARAVIPCWPA